MNEYAAPAQKSNKGTIALVLGIIGIVCCGLLGPVAWILGRQELNAIAAGQSPASGEGVAKAGMILGIIATVLLAFGLLWVVFFGGMAILQEMAG
jgi:uncharacterized iron-regulated membrane protein